MMEMGSRNYTVEKKGEEIVSCGGNLFSMQLLSRVRSSWSFSVRLVSRMVMMVEFFTNWRPTRWFSLQCDRIRRSSTQQNVQSVCVTHSPRLCVCISSECYLHEKEGRRVKWVKELGNRAGQGKKPFPLIVPKSFRSQGTDLLFAFEAKTKRKIPWKHVLLGVPFHPPQEYGGI
jgi:hypothetical protein